LADDNTTGVICICCCLIILIFGVIGMFSSDSSSSSSDIVVNNTVPEKESLPILNMTNETINVSKINFVYYDHNSSKFNGCYGLNYSVITDTNGTKYMLDHAETDILGEKTNYTFKTEDGFGITYDNNTETDIYKELGYYYIHELRYANGSIIKSLGNFTLNDQSHQPDIIPDEWLFVYTDHNSTTYEGDEGLKEAVTHNTIGNHEELHFVFERDIIGLAYESNKQFDYKYGLSGIETNYIDWAEPPYYTAWGDGLCYPNGTKITTFDIKSYNLIQKQKDFITNYYNRIDDVRHKQELDAIEEAEDDYYTSSVRYKESNKKSNYGYYFGSNGYGLVYTP